MSDKWKQPQEVDGLALAFGGNIADLMPAYTTVPDEFKSRGNKWVQFQQDWFFYGLADVKWKPKKGIDKDRALRHLKAIQASWEPKHEHKEAAVAYLASLWFDDVKYRRAKGALA